MTVKLRVSYGTYTHNGKTYVAGDEFRASRDLSEAVDNLERADVFIVNIATEEEDE